MGRADTECVLRQHSDDLLQRDNFDVLLESIQRLAEAQEKNSEIQIIGIDSDPASRVIHRLCIGTELP